MQLLFAITLPAGNLAKDVDVLLSNATQWLHKFQARFPELQVRMLAVNKEAGSFPGSAPSQSDREPFMNAGRSFKMRPLGCDDTASTSPATTRPNGEPECICQMTPRQLEVVNLMFKGNSYREIGEELGISLSTVRAHLHTIYQRLRVKTRAQAMSKILSRQALETPGATCSCPTCENSQ